MDDWNDWFEHQTQYYLVFVDELGNQKDIGNVKIGEEPFPENSSRPNLPSSFEQLNESQFSLGQEDTYYEKLNDLGDEIREAILLSLRDLALDLGRFEAVRELRVVNRSLMRSISYTTVRGQFHRQSLGGARQTTYSFEYTTPIFGEVSSSSVSLSFLVDPEDVVPSNLNVLIGRNGVGKSTILKNMVNSAVSIFDPGNDHGSFRDLLTDTSTFAFANIIAVSFSLFDDFPATTALGQTSGPSYKYVGFRSATRSRSATTPAIMTDDEILEEFLVALEDCRVGTKRRLWDDSMGILGTDQIFRDSDVHRLLALARDSFDRSARRVFRLMSSGHKIVLYSITKIISSLEEKSLLLIDEPETHLHPPLLAAYLRALSRILADRNGVAIVATHSPVILQEVKRSCTWILTRNGYSLSASRPELATLGENLGTLSREVFGHEVTESGFLGLLRGLVESGRSYTQVVRHLQAELGKEGTYLLRILTTEESADGED
jgi:predicted ATPase